MRLFSQVVNGVSHALKKKGFSLFLAAVTVGCGNQFRGLGHGERGVQVREDRLQTSAQPDIEEVATFSILNVLLIWWIDTNMADPTTGN